VKRRILKAMPSPGPHPVQVAWMKSAALLRGAATRERIQERQTEQDDRAGAEPQPAGDQHPHARCVPHFQQMSNSSASLAWQCGQIQVGEACGAGFVQDSNRSRARG
jgi:hypothetical protein